MTDPVQLIQAIAKADAPSAVVYARAAALDIGEQAARECRDALVPCMTEVYRSSVGPIVKSLGRDYVSKAASGRPSFDEGLLAALRYALGGYELFSKALTQDWFTVNGARIDVYRDESGRFARQSSAPTSNKNEAALRNFYQPGTANQPARRVLPGSYQRDVEADSEGRAAYKSTSSETEQKAVTFGVQALGEQEKFANAMRKAGVLPQDESDPAAKAAGDATRQRLSVQAVVQNAAGGSPETVDMEWSDDSGTFVLPEDYNYGYAITEIAATPRSRNDRQMAEALTSRQQYTHQIGDMSSIASAAAGLSRSSAGNLDVGGLTRSSRMMGDAGNVLSSLGFQGAGAGARAIGQGLGALDNPDIKRSMAMTSSRLRGIEAPQVDRRLQEALAVKFNPKSEDDKNRAVNAERRAYLEQTAPGEDVSDEALGMGLQRDNASIIMLDRLKRRGTEAGLGADLSSNDVNYDALAQKIALGIGRGMPSEGVLIDRKGRIVSQSMGVGSDHFVPFGAESVGRLNGGQYVRTRQLGGLTGEDLRTLLIGNGRAAQVVSGSGVYELELDPSLRGNKRYNDKTLQMIDTYDRILDEIAHGGLYATKLPPEAEAAAREKAKRTGGSDPANYREALRAARHEQYNEIAATGLSASEESKIRNDAAAAAGREFMERYGTKIDYGRGFEGNKRSDKFLSENIMERGKAYADQKGQQAVDDAIKQKARMLTLNSEGYALALNMLKQYYPYMVRTARYRSNEELRAQMEQGNTYDPTRSRPGAPDKWYTGVGSVRPAFGALSGGADEGAAKRERENARMGAPVNRADRKAYTGDYGQISPGGKAPSFGRSSGTSTTSAPAQEQERKRRVAAAVDQHVSSGGKQVRNALGSMQNLGDDADRMPDADTFDTRVIAAADDTEKLRLALVNFRSNPEKTLQLLASGDDAAQATLQAMSSKQAISSLAASRSLDAQAISGAVRTIDAMLAAQQLKSAKQVAGNFGSARNLPDYDGSMIVPEMPIMTPQNLDRAQQQDDSLVVSRAVLAAAMDNPTGSKIPLSSWRTIPDTMEAVASKYEEAMQDPGLRAELQDKSDSLEMIGTLKDAGLIDNDQYTIVHNATQALKDHMDVDEVLDPAILSDAKKTFALGAGVETMARLLEGGQPPKAQAPQRGQQPVGKSAGLTPLQRWIVDLDLPLAFDRGGQARV